jgi:hypothetical protein
MAFSEPDLNDLRDSPAQKSEATTVSRSLAKESTADSGMLPFEFVMSLMVVL